MYEESLRMPFIVRYPGKVKAGATSGKILLNVDFAPTLLNLANVKAPDEMQGKSFLPILFGQMGNDWRRAMYYHYYEYPKWHHVQPHYGIRTEQYKLIHFYYDIDVWELYDLQKDKNELVNEYNNPAYKEIITDLKNQLKKLQNEYGDTVSLEDMRKITDKGKVEY